MCSNCLELSFLLNFLVILFVVDFATGSQDDFFEDLRIELTIYNPGKIFEPLSCGYIHPDESLALLCSPSNELTSFRLNGLTLKNIPISISSLSQSLASFELNRSGIISLCKSFDKLTNLKHIDLGCNFFDAFPDSLISLTQLTHLDLRVNALPSIPTCLSSFTNLQYLDISGNYFNTFPDSFSSLSLLTHLDLGKSFFTSIPAYFSSFTNLQFLNFNNNLLSSLPDSLSSLTQLTHLDLHRNLLNSIPTCLSSFTNLQYLDLRTNHFISLSDSLTSLTSLSQLLSLDLGTNSLDTFPDFLSSLSQLLHLGLGQNLLSSLPDSLSSLTLLTHLDLGFNSFNAIPNCLSSFTNLQYLNLDDNLLSSLPDSLSSLSQLTHLNLDCNSFKTIPNYLSSFTSLKELRIGGNPTLRGSTDLFNEMNLLTELNVGNTLISGLEPKRLKVFVCYSSCISASYCSKNSNCSCKVYSPQECPQNRCGINSQQLCVDCLGLVSRKQCSGSCQWCSGIKDSRECYWCDFKKNDCQDQSLCSECSGHSTSSQCVADSDCQWCEYDYCAATVSECEPFCNNLSEEKCESKRDCLWCSSYVTCLDLTSQCLSCDRFTSSFCPPGCDCPSGSNSTVIIVVCVVCCVGFLFVCVCLFVWFVSRKRNTFHYYQLSQMPLHFDEDTGFDKPIEHSIISRYSECCVDSLFRVSQNILSFTSLGSSLKLCSPVTVSFEMTNICGMELVVESLFVKGFKEKHEFVFSPSSFTIGMNEKRKICVELTMKCSAILSPSQSLICCEISNTQQWCSLCGIQAQSELSSLLSCDDIELKRELGRGASGKVYLGSFKGTEVAVKVYPVFTQENNEKEANMFSKLHSPHIVTFFGISQTLNAMIIEYCKYGSVEGLYGRKEMNTWMKLLICSDCSLGMKYLHLNGIIHRDMKPENLLIVSFSKDVNTVRAKISDFGTSRFMNQTMKMTETIGTPSYMAPEVFNNESYGKKSDVYSFGLTVWAIFSKQTPYSELNYVHTILLKVNEGYRPQLCQDCPLNDLIERCWQTNPSDRPSFEEITEHIKQRIDA